MPVISAHPSPSERLRIVRFKRAALWCGRFAALCGMAMMALWVVRPPAGGPTLWLMKASTAECLTLGGLALALGLDAGGWQRRTSQTLLLMSGAIGLATLIDYAVSARFGVQPFRLGHLLDLLSTSPMTPQTAAVVVLFAVGALAAPRRTGVASHLCDGCIIVIAMLLHAVMSGYFFHDLASAVSGTSARMTPQAIFAFSVLWLGLIFARADAGLSQILSGDGRGSTVIRYLLPPTTVFPIVISSVRLWGEDRIDWAQYAPMFATVQSLTRIAVVVFLGYLLNRSEQQRKAEQTRREEAERLVAMCAWTRRVRWNGEWMTVDRFLKERFDLEVTHSISDEALQRELIDLALADNRGADGNRAAGP